jgi:hypothetical protein
MKFVVGSVFVALVSFVALKETGSQLESLVPQAAESAARLSLKAVADAAKIDALLAGEVDTSSFLADVVARTPNNEALTVAADGSVEWSDGQHCFRLFGGRVGADDRIVPCE